MGRTVNDVHKVTARKLRAFATAIRAEHYGPHEFGVREAMAAEAVELDRRADELDPPQLATITDDMVQRAAQVLYEAYGGDPDGDDDFMENSKVIARQQLEAALHGKVSTS